ncbi:anti-sigma factor domain-containing protein [Aureimonas sp. AU20]|uniref:anti-sigma factor n=1 Tax=Aureimonas sp. AU20 TaxID=1349819 RepID=UPI0007213A1A|nr:anti-sigma factor [Aureimonas sp. AU20]ALN71613.1 hypothetical protein M673_02740 [Aureimonas sp. AU20]
MSGIADPEGEGWLAADYALGVLPQRERLLAERRARQDPGFAAEIGEWEARLAPLAEAVRPESPPASLWAAIERELPKPRPAAASPALDVGRRVSAVWRWLALGSTGLLAASLASVVVLVSNPAAPPAPAMMASVSTSDGAALLTAVLDPVGGHAMLMPGAMPMPEGRVPELWIIPEGGVPISLGLLDPARPLRIALRRPGMAEDMMKPGGAMLAISAEPVGGSPTGQPTGPVLGTGALRSI